MFLATLTFAGILGTAFYSILSFQDINNWTNHTYEVIRSINKIEILLASAEDNQRTYLLANDPQSLTEYHTAKDEILPATQALQELIADNPVQVLRVQKLKHLLDDRLEKMD